MLICKECNKTIADEDNPKILYSTCINCGKNKGKLLPNFTNNSKL